MTLTPAIQYQEVCQFMRFYANIRYLLLPISAVSMGGIFYVVFASNGFKLTPFAREALKVFAAYLALTFLYFEFILNRYITKCATVARKLEEGADPAVSLRRAIETMWYRHLVPLTIVAVYVVIIAFWIAEVEWTAIQEGIRPYLPSPATRTA